MTLDNQCADTRTAHTAAVPLVIVLREHCSILVIGDSRPAGTRACGTARSARGAQIAPAVESGQIEALLERHRGPPRVPPGHLLTVMRLPTGRPAPRDPFVALHGDRVRPDRVRADRARPVGPRGSAGSAGLHGGNRRPAVLSHRDALSIAVWPGGHTGTRWWRRSSRIPSPYSGCGTRFRDGLSWTDCHHAAGPETTAVTPARPRSVAPHGAMQVTVPGTMPGKLRRSARVPDLTGPDVPRWRPGTTITDGRTDARLRG